MTFFIPNWFSKFLVFLVIFFCYKLKYEFGKKTFVYHYIFIAISEVFAALQSKGPTFCDVTLRRCKSHLHLEDPVD